MRVPGKSGQEGLPECSWVREVPLSPAMRPCDGVPQVFHMRSLLCPSEDEAPVSTALPIWLTSRACWAPNKAARLMVMHRNDNGMQLVVTTYELGAKKSRNGVDILGKDPVSGRTCGSAHYHHCVSSTDSSCFLWGTFSFLLVNTVTQQMFPCDTTCWLGG